MKQSFTVKMLWDKTTSGGQNLYFVDPSQKDNAGARNIYCTKNAFPPGVKPAEVDVTISYDDGQK